MELKRKQLRSLIVEILQDAEGDQTSYRAPAEDEINKKMVDISKMIGEIFSDVFEGTAPGPANIDNIQVNYPQLDDSSIEHLVKWMHHSDNTEGTQFAYYRTSTQLAFLEKLNRTLQGSDLQKKYKYRE